MKNVARVENLYLIILYLYNFLVCILKSRVFLSTGIMSHSVYLVRITCLFVCLFSIDSQIIL